MALSACVWGRHTAVSKDMAQHWVIVRRARRQHIRRAITILNSGLWTQGRRQPDPCRPDMGLRPWILLPASIAPLPPHFQWFFSFDCR